MSEQQWRLWVDPYSPDLSSRPYNYDVVEVKRDEWDTPQVWRVAEMHPATNVADLWWRPVAG